MPHILSMLHFISKFKSSKRLFNIILDGVVTKREMLAYLDPKHPYRAAKEAQTIIDAADSDGDGSLRIEEFMKVLKIRVTPFV